MKNSIFTIALLLATSVAFAQVNPTAGVVKTKTKSKNTNERIMSSVDSTLSIETKKTYVGHVNINRRGIKPNTSNTCSVSTILEVLISEKNIKKRVM